MWTSSTNNVKDCLVGINHYRKLTTSIANILCVKIATLDIIRKSPSKLLLPVVQEAEGRKNMP